MKSSNMKVVLLAILSSVVAFCIVLMLIYLLATASNNTKKNSANAAVQSQSDVAKKSTEANAQVSAEGCTLYYVNQDTDFFTADMLSDDLDAAEKEAAEMESNTISGLYTGTESATYAGYIELNYLDGTVFVPSTDVMPVSTSVILPLGSISQIIQTGAEYDYETGDEMPQFTGYSGCLYARDLDRRGAESHHCRRKPYHQLRRAAGLRFRVCRSGRYEHRRRRNDFRFAVRACPRCLRAEFGE